MKYTAIFVSALLAVGVLGATADKLSPDTRIRLEQRGKMMTPNSLEEEQPSIKVFIAVEPGFDVKELALPGVEIQSVFEKVVTANVTSKAIDALCQLDGVRYIQMATEVHLCNDFGRRDLKVDAVHGNKGNQLPQAYTGRGVVVGMIDTGVEYGHRAYYTSDGSELRIRRVWAQNGLVGAPEGYSYGTELATQSAILGAATDSRSQFHGSHTMATAAGGGDLPTKYYGMAPDADIVFVSFKTDDNTCIADGIKYIFDYADEMGMPCVINMSLGTHQGPHDGTSYLDQIIDEMSGPGHIIVGAAGNEGEFKMHASKTFTSTDKTLKTMLTLNSAIGHKYHYLDVWGTAGSNLKLNMGIFDSLKGRLLKQSKDCNTADPNQGTIMYYTYIDEDGLDLDAMIGCEINPENNCPHIWIQSELGDMGTGRMPGIVIEGDPGATVHVWNISQQEFSSNGKSGFTDGDHNYTIGEIGGTANRIISVGSYDGRDSVYFDHGTTWVDMNSAMSTYKQYRHSTFSSYGPTADGRTAPTIAAPGMPVISAINRYAFEGVDLAANVCDYTTDAAGRNYYYFYSMGTSMSAPQVSGIVAPMLQANPDLTPEQARQIMQETADTWADMGEVPNNAWGGGRINALECVRRAVNLNNLEAIAEVAVDGESTQVWGENGKINVSTPAVGATVRVYNLSGALVCETVVNDTFSTIDASQWGHGIFIAEISGSSTRNSFKVAL